MKTTGCNLDKVNMLPNALITPLISSTMIKSEDITPMEVTAEKRSPSIFKVSYIDSLVSALSHLNLKYKNSYSLSSLISFP
jgi:nuclear factor of activated T-cells 5